MQKDLKANLNILQWWFEQQEGEWVEFAVHQICVSIHVLIMILQSNKTVLLTFAGSQDLLDYM